MPTLRALSKVSYRDFNESFFAQRRLRRHARTWSVLAFGVGAVISGEFTGWNPGLIEGGFGGLLVATLVVSVMYVAMCASLAEMASAMPFAGNAYAFGRAALGPWGGFVAGLSQNVTTILMSAVIVVQIGETLAPALSRLAGLSLPEPLLWAVLYALFAGINIYGVVLFFRVAVLLAFAAVAVLAVFWFEALPFFELHLALNTPARLGGTPWLPNGFVGIAWALPFAIWFYVAIEQVPMAAEETNEPARVLPRALLYGMLILVVAAMLTLILNSGVSPGAVGVGSAKEPLLLGFLAVLVYHIPYGVLPFLFLIGGLASFHTAIYAFGRAIYVQSRAGYLPAELSLTHRTRQTPHRAILAGTLFGYALALVIHLAPGDSAVSLVLINMSVFSALISYVLTMLSYVMLARNHPQMKRPFASPLGATGAITALLIAAAAILLLFANPVYRSGLYGCAAILLGGVVYFTLRRRYRLIRSPEEAFALELEQARAVEAAASPRMVEP